ncbi:MAG: CinA family nicotinamide mononucleotide deamidase-related protein [Desulfosarcina sp.]|nr:CinA family nicotinamide mononucleotide deamidase-related protein [Desulfosarcina sp.]MBC2742782.1 CinA family nicotinamide mononucleotide deamidase-related protein [Desulfosarcina sp.]MBC2765692.1 CinA family nicotinamide mononucleotide deamidase-related protein [Desulfosarcina sp.]
MKAEILATGDEIRTGALVDSNSGYVSEKLEENGIEVVRHTSVGDYLPILVSTLREIGDRADVAVVTGGLGPTTDDLSAEAAAKAAGVALVFNETALENVKSFFRKFNRPMTASNRKQALLPDGCKILYNPVGTAPGFALDIGQCRFYFLPGVPYEMKRMLAGHVIPDVLSFQGDTAMHSRVKTITTFGLPESLAGEKVAGVESAFSGIKLGLRANFPQIQVKLYGRDKDAVLLDQRLEAAGRWASERLGKHVVSENGETMEAVIGKLLLEKSATLALAESCTGGLLANWLTNVAGSSDYFLFSGVTYSNQAKMDVLAVKPETLEKHGAVHEETAREMAAGARRVADATFGLSTSGIAGPDGGTEDKPVGTVCIGFAGPGRSFGRRLYFPFGKRLMNKKIFAMAALDILRKELLTDA